MGIKLVVLEQFSKDIKSTRLLYLKGFLFLLLGVMASANILLKLPSFEILCSLALAVWAFSRSYYFAFYVIEHYIDPNFKFAGLSSFVRYLWCGRQKIQP